MKTKRVDKPTPNGGAYSEIFYMDNSRNIVDESDATVAVIRECAQDGTLIRETWLRKDNGK